MNTNGKKWFILKKIILLILFVAFWVLLAINIFKRDDNKGLALAIFYVVLFMPVTISILFDYKVFALFIIILYEIAMALMGIVMMSIGLARGEYGALDIISLGIQVIYSLFMTACAVQYLRNKPHTLKIPCLILGIIQIAIIITSFALNGEFNFDTYYDFFRNLIIVMIFTIYLVTFPNEELHIFKDEK